MAIDLRARQKRRIYTLLAIVVVGPLVGYAIKRVVWWHEHRAAISDTTADTSTRLQQCVWAARDKDEGYRSACEKLGADVYQRAAASDGNTRECDEARWVSRDWSPWPDDVEAICGYSLPSANIDTRRLLVGDVIKDDEDRSGEIVSLSPFPRYKRDDGTILSATLVTGVVRLSPRQPGASGSPQRGDLVALTRNGRPELHLAQVLRHDGSTTWLKLGHDSTRKRFDGAVLRDGSTFRIEAVLSGNR